MRIDHFTTFELRIGGGPGNKVLVPEGNRFYVIQDSRPTYDAHRPAEAILQRDPPEEEDWVDYHEAWSQVNDIIDQRRRWYPTENVSSAPIWVVEREA